MTDSAESLLSLAVESLALSIPGGALGLLIAWWVSRGLVLLAQDAVAFGQIAEAQLDYRVLAFTLIEFVAGLWTGSLALVADAGHMLTDAGALGLALFASWIAARPPTPEKTYGYYRAEILAALVNAVVLLIVAGVVLYEAWRRILAPSPELISEPRSVVSSSGWPTLSARTFGTKWSMNSS